MNELNQSVYSSLKNYQETYEFYRIREEIPKLFRLKINQPVRNLKIIHQTKVA